MTIASPCIGTCRIDQASELCIGCSRSGDEIAGWRAVSDDVRRRIWAELPARRATLGIALHRLAWSHEEIRSFVAGTLRPGGGTWVFGVFGAVGEFCVGPDEAVDLHFDGETLVATTPRAAIRLAISDRVRALELASTAGGSNDRVIVLALPRARAGEPGPIGLADLGPDDESIRPTGREERLYDLGLGMPSASFGFRTADSGLIPGLKARIGQPWGELLAELGGEILRKSPVRVIRSPIGRIEVDSRIPMPGGESPPGPHTHFLPALLAAGRETPPGLDLPEVWIPCGIYYPGPDVPPGVETLSCSDRGIHHA